MNRRRFLKQTTCIAVGGIGFPSLVSSAALGKAGSVAASERITVGFIGTGGHGIDMNLKSFLAQPDAQAVAVCDVDPVNLQKARDLVNARYGNTDCMTTQDFREILARADIDAVMISTPDHWHVPISIAAAKAGKDVECEKPTLTVEEGRRLVQTMQRYGRVFQWSTEDRSVDVYHRMCELVRNGRIGKVHTIRVELPAGPDTPGNPEPMPVPEGFDYDMWLGPAPWAPYTKDRCHWNFRWIFDYSGGMLTDWGAHLLDGAQWGNDTEHTGPVEVEGRGVFCQGGLYDTAREYHLEYTYADGVKLFVDSGEPSLRFEGSEGWVGNRGWRGKLEASRPAILDSVIGPEEIHLYTCPGGEQRNFLDCVKSRQACYFPPEIGQRCFTIAHIGNIAMRLGRKLRWNPQEERFVNDDEANRMLRRAARSPWDLL
ncbi:MAG TPA: Gfo/Idh/MocA family oxidoreductase [Sedimentisphaerales bacterium]|nr:Gfo/Idh/MocA family oxidoreductase [Sedimentisphaerales bacterium]HRS11090.1 Gfo/Idh/MocA family oxidoreductase [Sedimentisphaerales bacterium]HRV47702.1 Gfo/Idh/MocA family oxidoreductase [Sedimentisphaerales bacterium]